MPLSRRWPFGRRVFRCAALRGGDAQTEKKDKDFQPQVGQAGKDVIWVPTPDDLVERMLRMAQTTPNDFVVDLGSGDGRTVIAAAKKFGARSMGIEYNPDMVELSNRNAAREGVTAKARFVRGDIFETDFSQATVSHDVPVARSEREAAAADPGHEAGDADRLPPVQHGGLAAR